MQMINFLKKLALIGGLLLVALRGPVSHALTGTEKPYEWNVAVELFARSFPQSFQGGAIRKAWPHAHRNPELPNLPGRQPSDPLVSGRQPVHFQISVCIPNRKSAPNAVVPRLRKSLASSSNRSFRLDDSKLIGGRTSCRANGRIPGQR